jgi:hypothetical protein
MNSTRLFLNSTYWKSRNKMRFFLFFTWLSVFFTLKLHYTNLFFGGKSTWI